MYSRKTPRFNFAQDCEFFSSDDGLYTPWRKSLSGGKLRVKCKVCMRRNIHKFFLRCFIFMSSSKEIVRRDKGMGRKATKKLYTVRMDEKFVAWVEKVARKIGRGRSELIREALVKLLLNEYRDLAVGQGATEYNNKRGSD
jgi:predicted DNA-binding protein